MLLLLVDPCTVKDQSGTSMVWNDEFNYSGLPDSTKWNYNVGCHGWGNAELQCYTDKTLQNARVENGLLTIEAKRENFQSRFYTSARLTSKGKGDWKYGRIEVRAKIPKGRGTWSAIWMLASTTPLKWPADGEIDIMEHVGFDQGTIHGAIHTEKYNHNKSTQKTSTITQPHCSDTFHIYSMEWGEKSIKVYVDNKQFFSFDNEGTGPATWPFDKPFHILLNLAVGGKWGGARGIDENAFPARMEVDYVRVYQ